jgi:hypothetical protein
MTSSRQQQAWQFAQLTLLSGGEAVSGVMDGIVLLLAVMDCMR